MGPERSLPPTSLPIQSGYCECAELILQFYPKQVDQVIHLTMQETVPESKMLNLLQYLCNASVYLLVNIMCRLAEHTTTAGQELLRFAIIMLKSTLRCLCTDVSVHVILVPKCDLFREPSIQVNV